MKYKLIVLFLLATAALSAQRKNEEIYSEKLDETRTITIVTPPLYKDDKNKAYPLVVVLDGEYLLDPFAGNFNYTAYWDDLPEVILVSINQNKGNKRTEDTAFDPTTGFPDESGAAFFEFISQELIPYMEEGYRIAPYKVIAGHNITAGFINSYLFKDKPVFDAYISLSPQLPADMEITIPARLEALKKPIYYYMAVADGDVEGIRTKAKALNTLMDSVKNPVIHYRFDELKDASHYALPVRAVPIALYHIFSTYQPISSGEYQAKIVTLPSGYAKYLEERYDAMEKTLGYKIPIRLNDFKAVEAAILKNGLYEEFRDLGELARKSYPKTIFGEYYTGLYFEMKGDKKRAIKTYVNSYSLKSMAEYTKDFMIQKAESIQTELKD